MVHADVNGDCTADPDEPRLAGVTMQLRDAEGRLVGETTTDAQGRYSFTNLAPGEYSVVQQQPSDYFDLGQSAGTGGGDASGVNQIVAIPLSSGQQLREYDFCESPPAVLSGYVFVDGPTLTLAQLPEDRREVQDGLFTADDTPLAGVVLRLRDGDTGRWLEATDALPGAYPAGSIQVQTNPDGSYRFAGLRGGRSYIVEEIQPADLSDGLDSAGSTGGVALNHESIARDGLTAGAQMAIWEDAIIAIPLAPGQASLDNNFSELRVQAPANPLVPPPPERTPFTPPPAEEPWLSDRPAPPAIFTPPPARPEAYIPAGNIREYTWHLSVIDAGQLRGDSRAEVQVDQLMRTIILGPGQWTKDHLRGGQWVILGRRDPLQSASLQPETAQDAQRAATIMAVMGSQEAIPVTGDFDGDGVTEVGLFLAGHWFLDLNGNGVWDDNDLWAKLGKAGDLPVTGDWDGDGKDDIGIFGPIWIGDSRALRHEPGLPDMANRDARPKTTPPSQSQAPRGVRMVQRTVNGEPRADLIDHVFHFGDAENQPVAGDWNGDGIPTMGLFRDGMWVLDVDGDGVLTEDDERFHFGREGDLPVVGDFDGDGVDEIGVFRKGDWWIDANHNHQLDAQDDRFHLGEEGDTPIVGDFDGDGAEEGAIYRFAPQSSPSDGHDQAA